MSQCIVSISPLLVNDIICYGHSLIALCYWDFFLLRLNELTDSSQEFHLATTFTALNHLWQPPNVEGTGDGAAPGCFLGWACIYSFETACTWGYRSKETQTRVLCLYGIDIKADRWKETDIFSVQGTMANKLFCYFWPASCQNKKLL